MRSKAIARGEQEQQQLPGSVFRGGLVQEVGQAGEAVTGGGGDS
ncbi:hypothetical protein ACH419_36540 [Streptomyces bobili]